MGGALLGTPASGPGASISPLLQHPEGGTCKDDSGCTPGKAERKAQGKAPPQPLSAPGFPLQEVLSALPPDLGLPCPRASHVSVLRLRLSGASGRISRGGTWEASLHPQLWAGTGVSPSLQASAQASAWPSMTLCGRVRSSAGAPWKWMITSHGNALSFQGAGSRVPKPRQRGCVPWKGSGPPSSNPTLSLSVQPWPEIPLALGQGP